MRTLPVAALFAAGALMLSAPAQAADQVYSQDEIANAFDVAFGVAVTSRYMSRGVAQSDGVAVQGYVEPSYGIFYAGVWASTVDLAPDDVEIDLYIGVRPTFGDLSFDIGYAHYFYDRTGSCCGEIYGKATYAFTEEFSAGVELYFDPDASAFYGSLNGAVVLPYDFTLSAAVGTNFEGSVDWNAGVSYTFAETLTLDLRYHDARTEPSRFVATLSLDTSWSALRGN